MPGAFLAGGGHGAVFGEVGGTAQAEIVFEAFLTEQTAAEAFEVGGEAAELGGGELVADGCEAGGLAGLAVADQLAAFGAQGNPAAAAIALDMEAAGEAEANEFIDGFRGGGIGDTEEASGLTDLRLTVEAEELQEVELGAGEGVVGDFGEGPFFEDFFDQGGEDVSISEQSPGRGSIAPGGGQWISGITPALAPGVRRGQHGGPPHGSVKWEAINLVEVCQGWESSRNTRGSSFGQRPRG